MKKYYMVSGINKEGYKVQCCTCHLTREQAEAEAKQEKLIRYTIKEIERD